VEPTAGLKPATHCLRIIPTREDHFAEPCKIRHTVALLAGVGPTVLLIRSQGVTLVSRPTSRALVASLFFITGTLHFALTGFFARIVPPQLPDPILLVQVSGICELLGAAGLLIPPVRAAAVYGLIALLVAVLPANIYMAIDSRDFHTLAPPEILWLRLPLQFAIIAWVYSVKRD
jgi:uncharacterized membrane protein